MDEKQQSQREILPYPYEGHGENGHPRPETLLGLIEWGKQRKGTDDDTLWREELLSTGKFAEELDQQNISKQEKLARIDEFYRQLYQQNADKHARLKRKQKYAEAREHMDRIRNDIKQEIEKHPLGILEVEMVILDSVSDRLLDVLSTYEEMRLWLQTKPGIAAELNVDLSREVDPDELRYMLTAALCVGSIPTGTALSLAKWREKIHTASAREKRSLVAQSKNKKIAEFVKELRDRHHLEWKKQDVANDIAKKKLKNPETNKPLNPGAVQRSPWFRKAWKEWDAEHPSASAKK